MGSGFTGQCYLNAEPLTSKSRTVIPFSISTCFQVYFISTFPIPNSITLLHALCPCSMHPAIDYLFRLPYSEFTYAGSIIPHSPFQIPNSKSLCHLSSIFRHLSSVYCPLSSVVCFPTSVLCLPSSAFRPLSFVICLPSTVLCHLSSVFRHLISAFCHLSSVSCSLSSVLCLPSSVLYTNQTSSQVPAPG